MIKGVSEADNSMLTAHVLLVQHNSFNYLLPYHTIISNKMSTDSLVPETNVLAIASHVGSVILVFQRLTRCQGCPWVSQPAGPLGLIPLFLSNIARRNSDTLQICWEHYGCLRHAGFGLRGSGAEYGTIQYDSHHPSEAHGVSSISIKAHRQSKNNHRQSHGLWPIKRHKVLSTGNPRYLRRSQAELPDRL